MTRLRLDILQVDWPYHEPFVIAGETFLSSPAIIARIEDANGNIGQGEAAGVYFLGETTATIVDEMEQVRSAVESGATRAELQSLLPAGGARNALDCAMWDLEARQQGRPVWQLAGLGEPQPLATFQTITVSSPLRMAEKARQLAGFPDLKLKLDGNLAADSDRIGAVRAARPEARIMVDANQGYTAEHLRRLAHMLEKLSVSLVEQPLARCQDGPLERGMFSIPCIADESCCSLEDLDRVSDRYDGINIKLDKTGGLTHALELLRAARARGLWVLVGNMVGSSVAMAPAVLLAQTADWADLDGTSFITNDVSPALDYRAGQIAFRGGIWGDGATLNAKIQ